MTPTKMEIIQLSLPIISIFLFFFMITKNRKIPKPNLPPGPRKLPFIGNLHQLIGPLPHHSLRNLSKKYGYIMHMQLGEVSAVIISSPEIANELMKTQDLTFVDRPSLLVTELRPNFTNLVFALYGEYWRQIRKICTLELLSVKRVKSYRSLREEEVTNLVKSISLSAGAPINLKILIFTFMNSVISRAAFGERCDEKNEFISAVQELIKMGGGFDLPDIFPSYKLLHRITKEKHALEKVYRKIDNILTRIIDGKKMRSRLNGTEGTSEKDLVDVLLNIQESYDLDFSLTTNDIKGVILDIFAGGTDTSSTAIEWAMSELIKNPKIMLKTQGEVRRILNGKKKVDESDIQEMNYLKLVIKETPRLHPPLPLLLPREARKECKINNYDIPIKTKVIINAWAIGRDPKYWENVERFDPDRFDGSLIDFKGNNFEFIPFGAGRRMCPGVTLGIANVELPLASLLYHFDWKIPNGTKLEEFDMSEAFGATVSRKDDLILNGIPYSP